MVSFVNISGVRLNRYYKLVRFGNGIKYSEILVGTTSYKNITEENPLGKLVQIRQYGRQYDPDVLFMFEDNMGRVYEFDPPFCSTYGYIDYDPEEDTEMKSMERIMERTLIMKYEIEGNDWALRPENVVATQGIDISGFAEGQRTQLYKVD